MNSGTNTIHTGKRVFAQGNGPGRTIGEIYFYFGIAGLALPFLRDASLGLSMVIAGIGATAFSVLILIASQGGLQITPTEVRVSGWRGTTAVSRLEIAEIVHIEDLNVIGMPKGFLALLDQTGKPLWRTATNAWTDATVEALGNTGRKRTVVPRMTGPDAAQRWPGMLPWSLANPMKAFWAGVLGTLTVLALLGVVLILLVDALPR